MIGLILAAAMVFAGCVCDGNSGIVRSFGDPLFVDGDGKRVTDLTVDFGAVLLGTRGERMIKVVNDGRGPFRVEQALDSEDFDTSFSYQFEPFTLNVGESREIRVVFEPTVEGEHASGITFMVSDATLSELKLTVQGLGVNGRCVITPQDSLDFGSIAQGTSFIKQVKISNSSTMPWKVTIGQIKSDIDPGVFKLSGLVAGQYEVPAQGELLVPIEFTPNHKGQHTAFLEIPAPAMCQPSVLPLKGNGVDNVLECEPKVDSINGTVCQVDFGFVNPGSTATGEVTFRNLGPVDLEVTLPPGALAQPPGKDDPYSVETNETKFSIPKDGGTAVVPLAFVPSMLGPQAGSLTYTSTDPKRSQDKVILSGIGGGPDIEVLPAALDFGPVGLETYQRRRLTIANVGTDVGGTAEDNLRLTRRVNGEWVEAQAELVTDSPDEFSLEPMEDYKPIGIAAGQSAELTVKFFPKTPGAKTATVRIYSNDPDEPVTEVVVKGLAKTMPPCDYSIIPSKLSFGNVENGKFRTMSFYLKNNASNPADECLVSTLGFSRNTPDVFALTEGELTGTPIPGGEALEIPVRCAPKKDGQFSGAVEFYISSKDAPEGKVMLSCGSKPGCLMVAPSDLDFGVIETGCSSRERDFTVYNVCPTTIRIDSIDLQAGLSTEFAITQRPSLPVTLAPNLETRFKVSYRPTDVGEDTGSIAIQTAQLPDPYVVTLSGRGATVAEQTDVFAQDAQPKVDVLLVVDNSCSMSDEQDELAANFASFIRFAEDQKVDYHIAVTNTGVSVAHGGGSTSSDDANGRFMPLAGADPRVLTPNTPNVASVFGRNVKVGTSGNYSEMLIRPAYLALTAPNITGHNKGFLRDEAHLAVVVVSDADDQDRNVQVPFYQNFFLNIKGFNRPNMFSFNAIIPTHPSAPSGCSYDSSSAGSSTRVKELVDRTNGIREEICTSDWAKALEGIGRLAFGYKTRFPLQNPPAGQLVTVQINGVDYPQYGAFGDRRWSYNSVENAVDFEPLAVPEPGSTLTVSYVVACLPVQPVN